MTEYSKASRAAKKQATSAPVPKGTLLELSDASGKTLWTAETELSNPWALVSDFGTFVALGEWARDIDDKRALEIWADGKRVAAFAPQDLASAEELKGIMRSVSHVSWGRAVEFDAKSNQLVIEILQGGNLPPIYEQPPPLRRRIDLGTGTVVR